MTKKINIAIDAMGGSNSPKKIIEGIKISLKYNQDCFFFLYGHQEKIEKEIYKNKSVQQYCKIINTNEIILDNESPLVAAKRGKQSSMWKAIESQKENKSDISLSAGNTGALLVISRLILNTINGINKPALAGLWPNNKNMNVVLDLGANVECSEKNLLDFVSMGSALFKSLFNNVCPKIALLNIGLEENKGNDILRKTFSILKEKEINNFKFCGYIEGNHIMDGNVDVIVTDGFTGNVALKTAEGTANFITNELKKAMKNSILGKLGSLISISSLKKFKKKLDPRLYNGAILLGLDSPVIKSHGGTDYIGFANSLSVCEKIVKNNLIDKIKNSIN
jgi:glycerol-3-phosphate acyltransferase PlsX